MSYEIDDTALTGGDSPEEPGNPRTFPIRYNALIQSIQNVLSEIDATESGLQDQITALQSQVNQLSDDFGDFKTTTESRLDALEAEPE